MTLVLRAPRRVLPWRWLIPICGMLAIANLSGWIDSAPALELCRPLILLLFVVHAARLPSRDKVCRRCVLAGLGCMFLGECAMAFAPTSVAGLLFAVLAQCCYLVMIHRTVRRPRASAWHVLYALVVGWALVMWSARPLSLFVPTAVFMCLLGLMSAQADVWWWRSRGTPQAAAAASAAWGGLCWMLADLLWTFSQHVFWVPGTIAGTLTLYWLAQWCLASIIGTAPAAVDPRT